MITFKIKLCIITTFIVGISCSPTNVDAQAISEYGGTSLTNNAALFETQPEPSSSYDGITKTIDIDTQRRKQNKDTGFDVPIDGFHFDNNCDHTRPWLNRPVPGSPGIDSGFDGIRPGFSHSALPDIDSGFGQKPNPGYDLGFDGTRPGFAQKPNPGFDAGFDGTRPGFSNGGYSGTGSSFEVTRPGYAGGYNVNQPGFAESPQYTRPWFVRRTRRQVNYPLYEWQPEFDQPQQFGFVSGFDNTGLGYGQYTPSDFDSNFDGTQSGFNQRIRREALSDNIAELQALEDTTFTSKLQGGVDTHSRRMREQADFPGRSQNIFFLQPHKNNRPYMPMPGWQAYPYNPGPYGSVGAGNPYNPGYGNPYNPGVYGNSGSSPGPYW